MELTEAFQELGPYAALLIALIVLGRMYFDMRKTEANSSVELAKLQTTLATAQMTADKERAQREERLATALAGYQREIALVNAGTMTALTAIVSKQDQAADVAVASERTVTRSVSGARDDIIAHIDALREFISKSFDVFTADQAGFVERYEAALEVFRIKTEQIAEAQEIEAVA